MLILSSGRFRVYGINLLLGLLSEDLLSGPAFFSLKWAVSSPGSTGLPARTTCGSVCTAAGTGWDPAAAASALALPDPFPLTSRLEPDILLRAKQDFLKTDSDSDLQ